MSTSLSDAHQAASEAAAKNIASFKERFGDNTGFFCLWIGALIYVASKMCYNRMRSNIAEGRTPLAGKEKAAQEPTATAQAKPSRQKGSAKKKK